ncbi:MAG: phosphatidate cytidylyltransferase [Methylotenera sp.]
MLKTRIITALVLVAGFVPALFKSPNLYWAIGMLVVTLLALREWASMVGFNKVQIRAYLIVSLLIGLFVLVCLQHHNSHHFFFQSLRIFSIATLFWTLIVPIWLAKQFKFNGVAAKGLLGWLLMLPLWLALICAKIVDPMLVLVLLGTIWIADSAAYFAGKNFGKHKLAPTISPGKTWEGVAGALIGVTIFGAILYLGFDVGTWAIFPALWIITGFGVIGDLFESMMKRQANIKDSGDLLPGHGGVLDRIDGIIPSLPIAILLIYAYNYFGSLA